MRDTTPFTTTTKTELVYLLRVHLIKVIQILSKTKAKYTDKIIERKQNTFGTLARDAK